MQSLNAREERGRSIAQLEGQIRRNDATSYEVKSQSGKGIYQIIATEYGWACACPDNQFRNVDCKHIHAVRLSLALRQKVAETVVIQPINSSKCARCGSENIVRHGLRHNKCGDLQRFSCRDCKKRFTINLGFERMKATPETVTMAMQMYFSGMSFQMTANALKLKGVKISGVGVFKWTKKYVALMESYVDSITPQVGETWRTDELYVKIRGNMRYLFGMMDDDTRFRIAQMVAVHKGTDDVRPMFRESIERTGKRPATLISDGANNFHDAYRKEFWSPYGEEPSPVHVRDVRFDGSVHNNKMERQNGEWRDREKVMRSLKSEKSPVIGGMQIFHNFIRPHMGLGGKTPAEAAGIKVEGENAWLTLIQNASKRYVPTVNAPLEEGDVPKS
jgi:putative transposase